MAKVNSKYHDKFNPFITTKINGQVAKVTRKELEDNPRKYINTPVGYMYENFEQLKESISKRSAKKEFNVIDMGLQKRGQAFAPERKEAQKRLYEELLEKQAKKRKRLLAAANANLDQTRKEAAAKAKAEKAAAKAKAEKEAAKNK